MPALPKIESANGIAREGRNPTANSYENVPSKGRNKRPRGSGTIAISTFRPLEKRVKKRHKSGPCGLNPFRLHH